MVNKISIYKLIKIIIIHVKKKTIQQKNKTLMIPILLLKEVNYKKIKTMIRKSLIYLKVMKLTVKIVKKFLIIFTVINLIEKLKLTQIIVLTKK